jgi:tRNA(Ile)-lysidine synthase
MHIDVTPGKYVVAVSGGVDSVALLDILVNLNQGKSNSRRDYSLTIAHFDHGIRPDSAEDRRLVQAAAQKYGLPFVYDEGNLGTTVSEAAARQSRYKFLRQVRRASGAHAIITAHHQDDLLETAILNLLRGTGRKGLTSLASRSDVVRPLLNVPKLELIAYAHDQGLVWREDSTNQDQIYLRNYVRHRLLSRFDEASRERLLALILNLQATNRELDELLTNQLHLQSVAGTIDRPWFNQLPHQIAREVMATWLRVHQERGFDRRALERLVVQAKVAYPGQVFPLSGDRYLRINRENLALAKPER